MSEKELKNCKAEIECESPAVISYLNLLQSVIIRMASNSAACKSWCITLASAIVVVLINKDKGQYVSIAIAPTILFALLDCYYLAMEKTFREKYNSFIKKLHSDTVEKTDLFIISLEGGLKSSKIMASTKSISIYPFYVSLIAMIIAISLAVSDTVLILLH